MYNMKKTRIYSAWLLTILFTFFSQISLAAHPNQLPNQEPNREPDREPDQEVQHLITFISNSNATFIRNGDEHTSKEAAEHLAMKYRKAKRYAKTADDFINNLASKSSWSGKAYTVILSSGAKLTANSWLTNELIRFRNTKKP
ncbi:conserved protein of unknown function; putative transmembrane protein [Pseudoalteromonas translucida]|uniref:Orphan protein n=3 Tax=Pseudoalteromonas TaxID=53246 RepID=Q3IJK8_PSET1|nr:conserved protein of unknown function; putative transmembrane protein [Pseudoalteromonas translucida]